VAPHAPAADRRARQPARLGRSAGPDAGPELVQLYLDRQIDIDPFSSHRISLDVVNRGFELMEHQDGIRGVIAFD
jgi:S-(hydroxymethyl)glutathione dehydrogenase / alcohol dehydrogenase